IHSEGYLLGNLTTGVFSIGDLEANYQGFVFLLDLCGNPFTSTPPILEKTEQGKWRLKERLDIGPYLNPHLDESFTLNIYSKKRWEKVLPIIQKEYCPLLASERIMRRFENYR